MLQLHDHSPLLLLASLSSVLLLGVSSNFHSLSTQEELLYLTLPGHQQTYVKQQELTVYYVFNEIELVSWKPKDTPSLFSTGN